MTDDITIEKPTGKLGVLLPGLGAVATTFISGIAAIKKGIALPIGSLTQLGTIRLGKRTEKRVPMIRDFIELAGTNDFVFGGGDHFPDNIHARGLEAAARHRTTPQSIENEGEFPMTAGIHLSDEGYMMTDMPLPRASYQALAATALRFDRLFAHSRTLTIMVKIRDEIAGRVSPGKARRIFGPSEREKLASGYRRASEILRNAGAKKIFKSRIAAAHPGGTVPIGEHVDTNLQTEREGLYVCDCSVIADPWGLPPVLTLISLAKRLAKHLA